MVKPVSLSNGRVWQSKKAALAHFKSMLARYSNGDTINAPSDIDDLCALLARYDKSAKPESPTKIGVGIAFFSRQRNAGEGWSTDGFHVHRIDGTSDDFSYISAVNSEPTATQNT